MTLEQIILYPLNHRMVSEAFVQAVHAATMESMARSQASVGYVAPVKAKRAYTPRKAKA